MSELRHVYIIKNLLLLLISVVFAPLYFVLMGRWKVALTIVGLFMLFGKWAAYAILPISALAASWQIVVDYKSRHVHGYNAVENPFMSSVCKFFGVSLEEYK